MTPTCNTRNTRPSTLEALRLSKLDNQNVSWSIQWKYLIKIKRSENDKMNTIFVLMPMVKAHSTIKLEKSSFLNYLNMLGFGFDFSLKPQ